MGFEDHDDIEPSSVEHKVDEVIIGGEIEQAYNYIEYWFESSAGRIRARAYLGPTGSVSIYPPIRQDSAGELIFGEDDRAREAVIRYFSRRFTVVKELGLTGYSAVWMSVFAKRIADLRGLAVTDL